MSPKVSIDPKVRSSKYMRNIVRCLPLFVLFVAPMAVCAFPLAASAQPVYNDWMTKVLHMPEEPLCKVLIDKEQKSFQVEVKGSHNIYDPYTGKKLDAAFLSSSYPMVPTSEGIKWGQDFPGVYQIVVIPDNETASVTVNGVTYGGVVAFYQIEDKLSAVNWISLDDMTSSLLSSNFLPRDAYQKEVIAAYAIALRSIIHHQIMNATAQYWDIKAEDCGYQGKSVTRSDAPFIEAMKATKKIVMIGGTAVALNRKVIETLRVKMPSNDIEDMAKDGKDARVILHRFYPESTLGIAEKRPASTSSYLR